VREDERLIGGKGWKERVYTQRGMEEVPKMARNNHILHKPRNE
jgi:hypothetical protein